MCIEARLLFKYIDILLSLWVIFVEYVMKLDYETEILKSCIRQSQSACIA